MNGAWDIIKQKKHDDRLSVLSKIEDKYNYDDIIFPVNFNHIKTFENYNKVCINVYYISDGIFLEYVGNIDYIENEVIYLLRIEDKNQSHYVYIKHIERLLNFNSYTKKDNKKHSPWNKNVLNCRERKNV